MALLKCLPAVFLVLSLVNHGRGGPTWTAEDEALAQSRGVGRGLSTGADSSSRAGSGGDYSSHLSGGSSFPSSSSSSGGSSSSRLSGGSSFPSSSGGSSFSSSGGSSSRLSDGSSFSSSQQNVGSISSQPSSFSSSGSSSRQSDGSSFSSSSRVSDGSSFSSSRPVTSFSSQPSSSGSSFSSSRQSDGSSFSSSRQNSGQAQPTFAGRQQGFEIPTDFSSKVSGSIKVSKLMDVEDRGSRQSATTRKGEEGCRSCYIVHGL